jgi:PIN like domain
MRDLFPGYYKPTSAEFDDLWRKSFFAFDANVLLNIYRYSEDTRNEFLSVLNSLRDRIWLPYQAAFEYQENRLNVLSAQFKAYDEIPKFLTTALSNIETSFPRHPFIPMRSVKDAFNAVVQQIGHLLLEAKTKHPDLIENDELRETLDRLFDGRVGDSFTPTRIAELIKEGERRFEKQVPPGYRDAKKEAEKKYGDFFVWTQLKDFAKAKKTALVLVTDDRKDDWWLEHKGKTIGPRPELIQEMKDECSIHFYMYQSDQFIEHAQKLSGSLATAAVAEVREVREQESFQNKVKEASNYWFMNLVDELQLTPKQIWRRKLHQSALLFIAVAPRTFKELREFFDSDSEETRTFIKLLFAQNMLEVVDTKPQRFGLTANAIFLADRFRRLREHDENMFLETS